ncbi:acyl-CoA Delta(11) desaturase-like [Diachasmimorpha longicaudata]|uniref:acyl-CoA Delta(11) desaturase-like n=1 Tax=Diachasmimorpha longicaudata TaxID=58733 RepID=UPI0030B91011
MAAGEVQTASESEDLKKIFNPDGKKEKRYAFGFKTQVYWGNVIGIFIWHLLSFYYFITFPYLQHKGLVIWAFVLAELNLLSITAGVHRLWCHRAYKAKAPLRLLLAVLYYSTGENRIIQWVREHRCHHKYADTDGDPHNSQRGFFFSHFGWQMMRKHDAVINGGNTIDLSDVEADPIASFFDKRYVFFKTLFCFFLPVFVPVYFFDQDLKAAIITQWLMRYPYVVNMMFSVNSFAHTYGYRSYDKTIRPAENGIISLLMVGEGWHNYHHAFPWDYKASELGWALFNRTTFWINFFAKIGWAYDLREATPDHLKRIIERKGDGTHPIHGIAKKDDEIEVTQMPYAYE